MIDRLDIRPNDRLLLLSIPDMHLVSVLARRLEKGLLVGLGKAGVVRAARKAFRDRVNVMFQPGSAEGIPWQDGFFSRVIDLHGRWTEPGKAAREVARVLAPGGSAYLALDDPVPMLDCGFAAADPIGEIRVFRLPDRPASRL